MFKHSLKFAALALFIFIASSLAGMQPIECAPQLQSYMNKIQRSNGAKKLIEEIQQDGPIRVMTSNHALCKQFGAFWDIDNRTISIYLDPSQDEGTVIGSIIFELHNAKSSPFYDRLDQQAMQGSISRESYIEACEYEEYKNSKSSEAIADEGIRAGFFPRNAKMMTYSSFEEHFYYQKISGHSDWFGRNYDQFAPERVRRR